MTRPVVLVHATRLRIQTSNQPVHLDRIICLCVCLSLYISLSLSLLVSFSDVLSVPVCLRIAHAGFLSVLLRCFRWSTKLRLSKPSKTTKAFVLLVKVYLSCIYLCPAQATRRTRASNATSSSNWAAKSKAQWLNAYQCSSNAIAITTTIPIQLYTASLCCCYC